MTVTRDATSLMWTPRSAAEYTALLSGRGISNPILLWMPGDPASGNVPDLIGTFTGISSAGGGVHYQSAVAGWTTKCLLLDDGAVAKLVNQDAGLPDISTTSAMVFAWIGYTATPGTERSAITLGPNYGTQTAHDLWASTPPKMALAWGGGGSGALVALTTANASGVHPVILQHDRSTTTQVFQTEAETKTHAISTETGKSLALGGDNVNWWFAGGTQHILVALWSGASAELDTAHRAALIDAHVNGPAVTSISVTPTPVTLAVLGTQQLAATASRADTSTYVCTDGTNIPSTATATWTSDNPSVATVSATGLVTAVAAGVANITRVITSLGAATATSNASVVTVSGSGTPTIKKLTMTPSTQTLIAGKTKQASVIATYSDLSTVDITKTALWSSSAPSIASAGTTGLISAVSVGTTGVMATPGIIAYPQTAAAMATAVGFGTWGAGYLLDEIATPLVPVFGSPSLALTGGTPIYSQPGALGAGDFGIGFVAGAGTSFSGGNVFNVSATDDVVIAWVGYHSANPTAFRTIVGKGTGATPFYAVVVDNVGNLYGRANDGSTLYSSSVPTPIGKWYVGMMVVDRGAGKLRLATQTLDGTAAALGTAVTVAANALATSGNFLFGACAGVDGVDNATIAALWINTGSGVASTMSANLGTATANLASCLMASCAVTTAPYLSSIDHVLAALSRLPSQFQKPKIQNLIRALAYPANELEQAMWAVLTQRSITNALGAQLDTIGGIVGQDRNGLNDDDYRRYISARVIAERSHGNVEDLYAVANLVVGDPSVTFALTEDGTATTRMLVRGAITDTVANILWSFLHAAVASGVRIILEYSTVPPSATFTLDTGPGLDTGRLAAQIG